MTFIIIFILGILVGAVFVWVIKNTCKSEHILGGAFGRINKKKREQVKIQKDNILKFVKEHGRVTNDNVQKELGVSDATATRYLDAMEKNSDIVQKGEKGRYVYYVLK